jgi:hypothetical protein
MLISCLTMVPAWAQISSQNCTLLGRWAEGDCNDVVIDGNTVYLGNGAYLQIMDCSDPANPQLLGRVALPMIVQGLALRGDKIYVADYDAGLRIVDVSNPAAPVEIGALEKIGSAYDVVIEGTFAYIAGYNKGLVIADISDPANPILTGNLQAGTASAVALSGNYVYVIFGSLFTVVDISDKTKPTEIAKIELPTFAEEIVIQGNCAYVACNTAGLRIIDISNPASPVEVGACLQNKDVMSVTVENTTAYVAGFQTGLYRFDVSTPSSPVKLDSLINFRYIRGISVQNDLACVARCGFGMSSVRYTPGIAANLLTTVKTGSYWMGLDVQDNWAYLCGGDNIRIIDCADVMNPNSVSYLDVGNYDSDKIAVDGHYAYCAACGMGIEVIDLSTPENPVICGKTDYFEWSQDVAVRGTYAYVADYSKGLRIVDITVPQAPVEVGKFDTRGMAYGVSVQEPYAFVADYDSGLCIVNVADVRNPVFVAQIATTSFTMDAAARGHDLFIADGKNINVYDISDIANPRRLGGCSAYGFARQIELSGDYAFVADAYGGAAVFDITDPSAPARIGFYTAGSDVHDIAVRGNLIYALDNTTGLYIIRFDAPTKVGDRSAGVLPAECALSPNYPNPFNSRTVVEYRIDRPGEVRIEVVNLLGETVALLSQGHSQAGVHKVVWQGSDDAGRQVPSGVYLVRLSAGGSSTTGKVLLLR